MKDNALVVMRLTILNTLIGIMVLGFVAAYSLIIGMDQTLAAFASNVGAYMLAKTVVDTVTEITKKEQNENV
jgi:hypothetical protein